MIYCYLCRPFTRRRVRVVEGARLESVYTGNCIASSNLAVSAAKAAQLGGFFVACYSMKIDSYK